MNFLNVLPVVLLIAFFGLLAIGAIAAFTVSIIQQRRYNNAALPSLDLPDVETSLIASEDEEVTESRFETSDEELILEDEDTNLLMKNIGKLDGSAAAAAAREPKRGGFSFLNSKKNETNGKESK